MRLGWTMNTVRALRPLLIVLALAATLAEDQGG